ncbi:6-chlorohydroxyquinol-1,2-dioxygenase, partial [Arthrobacter sp. TS-15]|uniref:dioxygenase n=2 Tax=Actinomycetes TaxID=1760 RepID=UPI0011713BD8
MTIDASETAVTEEAVGSLGAGTDPRLRELLTGLIRHLHDFARETRLTQEEWERAIGFLTATGQTCTDTRQEFILLSDVLGLSMLVETLNADRGPGATESTVLGPFHMTESPVRELGADIDLVGSGEPCVVSGRVLSQDGTPLPGAVLDVWQADTDGFYDVQQPDLQPPGNGRGLFTADAAGRFWFRTCV